MEIAKLGCLTDSQAELAGGKAKGLDRLIKAGFTVAQGFVIIGAKTQEDFKVASKHAHATFPYKKVAVRSSATAEDGADFSYAGQFRTILNVKTGKEFESALIECLDSLNDFTAKEYTEKFGKAHISMSVVVQEMVDADFAGVCFSSDPSEPNKMLVETVRGLGESLVSGESKGARYCVSPNYDDVTLRELCKQNDMLSEMSLKDILEQAKEIANAFGMPMDTEFAIKGKNLIWLQARPITVTEVSTIDELDPKCGLDGCVTTRCNIGEMLPGAVTPLTHSVSVYAIDWGLRKMLHTAGANKKMKEFAPFECIFSSSGHLFFNLSSVHKMSLTAAMAERSDVDMSICGRVLDEEDVMLEGKKKSKKIVRINNMRKYLGFLLSRKKARRKLIRLSDNFAIGRDFDSAAELYREIDRNKYLADEATLYHYITSAHSGAMSSAAIRILEKKFGDNEKAKSILAQMLSSIDGIESVDILRSLRCVARAVLKDNPSAVKFTSEQLTEYMRNARGEVKATKDAFMKRHGHRAIREAEMRNPGWDSDERAFIEFLATVIRGGAKEADKVAPPDIKSLIKGYGFKGATKKILGYLIGQARDGVRNREFTKSRMIKVLDVLKKAYTRLGVMLCDEGKLPDSDLVYFLTHEELDLLVRDGNATLVKKAIQRRRLLKEQSTLRFAEVYTGKPKALPPPKLCEQSDILSGTPISRGTATGIARIVRSGEDAAKLQKGEIMIATHTDIGWSPFYCVIEALVTEVGSALSHGAVVAREYALPLVSNVTGATAYIRNGDKITVDGTSGKIFRHSA